MKKEELAARLNGRLYGAETTKEEVEIAAQSGLVIIYGAGDDIVELEGAIVDEIGACEGAEFIIATPGTEIPADEDMETYRKAEGYEVICIEEDSTTKINRFAALWSPEELECSWLIKTTTPHASFDIMEDDELFCMGIVVDLKDLATEGSKMKELEAVIDTLNKRIELLTETVKKYGELEEAVAKFYEDDGENGDLCDIGEICATKLGYL